MLTLTFLLLDELPQTVTIKESVSSAPADASVKTEPLDTQEKEGGGGPLLPPPGVTVTAEMKKEEPKEEFGKDEEEDDSDRPCTKMTMRLRRNINNPQCVSR